MGRARQPRVAVDDAALESFRAGLRRRYSDEEILEELRASAGRLGRSPTMREFAADEGARIIDRLGFLNDAVPAIRHHHERWDGTGYPERLEGEEIPLGARIIHVADALDSMLTTRIDRAARPAMEAMDELKRAAGTQFCPRCVGALERILPLASLKDDAPARPQLLAI